jgi:hypothetical protein
MEYANIFYGLHLKAVHGQHVNDYNMLTKLLTINRPEVGLHCILIRHPAASSGVLFWGLCCQTRSKLWAIEPEAIKMKEEL